MFCLFFPIEHLVRLDVGGVKLAITRVFTPQKLAGPTNWGFLFFRDPVVKHIPANH